MPDLSDAKARRHMTARNVSGEEMIIGSFVEVTGLEDDTNFLEVIKPSGDSLAQVYITTERIAAGKLGAVSLDYNTWVNFSGTTPSIGDTVGTVDGEFEASDVQEGFLVLAVDTEVDRVAVRPFSRDGEIDLEELTITFSPTIQDFIQTLTASATAFSFTSPLNSISAPGGPIQDGILYGVGLQFRILIAGPAVDNVPLTIRPWKVTVELTNDSGTLLHTIGTKGSATGFSLFTIINIKNTFPFRYILEIEYNFHTASIINLSEPATKLRYKIIGTVVNSIVGQLDIRVREGDFFGNERAFFIRE